MSIGRGEAFSSKDGEGAPRISRVSWILSTELLIVAASWIILGTGFVPSILVTQGRIKVRNARERRDKPDAEIKQANVSKYIVFECNG